MTVKELLERTEYDLLKGNDSAEVSGLSFDNRKVRQGDLFVCIRGVYFDTHSVIGDIALAEPAAIIADREWASSVRNEELEDIDANIIIVEDTRAAKACVSAAFYGYPSEKMTVIGVTGSKGKTSTAHMIWSILNTAGHKTGMVGTTGGHIGDTDHHFGTTTPDSDQMQNFLAEMVDNGCEYAVVEASSQGLKLHRTDYIDFDYGIFLNIEKGDHVSPTEHKTFEEYLACKKKLLEQSTTCIVNGDDEHIEEMLDGIKGHVIRYGYDNNKADHIIQSVKETEHNGQPSVSFSLTGSKADDYVVGLPGLFNAGNAAAAILTADECGVSHDSVKAALMDIKIPGRLDMVYRSDRLSVCVDYAHNGLSTRNLLKALRSYHPKRIVCVFGCGGNRDVDRRPEMGKAAGELADLSIITTEHNRFEEFRDILNGIMEGMNSTQGRYEIIEDRKEAIRHAIIDSEPGDLVTILGIGNDGFQHDHGKDIPHDDIGFSKQIIGEWLKQEKED